MTLNQKEIATVYGSGSLSEVDEALTREELNTKEKTLQLSPKSSFKKHYDDLYIILKNKVTNANTVNEAVTSSLYSDTLVERLLKQLLPTTPLWNRFLRGDLHRYGTSNVYKLYGQYRAANPINMASQTENLFPIKDQMVSWKKECLFFIIINLNVRNDTG